MSRIHPILVNYNDSGNLKSNLGRFPGIYSWYFNQLVVNDFPFAFEWFARQDIPEWKIKQDTVYPIRIPSCQYLKNLN